MLRSVRWAVTWVSVVALVLGACFISPVMRFGGGKTRKQAQHDQAAKLTPPAMLVDDEFEGEVRTAKIRVWADDDHRAQNVRWQQTFQELLGHANEILAAQFGVRLEAEYRTWNHRPTPGDPLSSTLSALAAEDSGGDVLAVVGLTSALGLVSSTFEQLGLASVPGRHMVLRGYADVGERAAFDQTFKELDAKERDTLYKARRRHKTVSLLLHELGHNLGAQHRAEPNTMMSPSYSHQVTSFDTVSRDAIQLALDRRLGRASRPSPSVPQPDAHPTLIVIVDASGNRIIGGNIVDDATLDGLLKLHYNDDRETAVLVKTRDKAPQTVVIEVLERAKVIGLSRISIARE